MLQGQGVIVNVVSVAAVGGRAGASYTTFQARAAGLNRSIAYSCASRDSL